MSKTYLWVFATTMLAISVAFTPLSYAQTTSIISVQAQLDLITSLMAQIKALQQQIQNLNQQAQTAAAQLVSTLPMGSQGDQVKILQALLAADPNIYPEGLITGFFGPATERAVKRFQQENDLEQVGNVGPKTLEKLNEMLDKNPIALESTATSTTGGEGESENQGIGQENRPCAIVSPGHLIAPGWLRHHGGSEGEGEDIVPACQTIPSGIASQLGITSSTTPASLVISSITSGVTTNTATIAWLTNNPANSQINYGLTSSYGSSTMIDTVFATSHSEIISGLAAGTMYHFQVVSKDIYGDAETSSDQTFTTGAVTAVTLPVVTAVSAGVGTSTANIMWTTNVPTNSLVVYGVTQAYGSSTVADATLVTSHSQMLAGLIPSTMYHFQVKSSDSFGNLATSPDQIFTTNALPPLPVMSNLLFLAASTTASASWNTNVPTLGKIFYSTVSPVDMNGTSTLSVGDSVLNTSHLLNLSGLSTSTAYFFFAQSIDVYGNVVTSTQQTFTTASQ